MDHMASLKSSVELAQTLRLIANNLFPMEVLVLRKACRAYRAAFTPTTSIPASNLGEYLLACPLISKTQQPFIRLGSDKPARLSQEKMLAPSSRGPSPTSSYSSSSTAGLLPSAPADVLTEEEALMLRKRNYPFENTTVGGVLSDHPMGRIVCTNAQLMAAAEASARGEKTETLIATTWPLWTDGPSLAAALATLCRAPHSPSKTLPILHAFFFNPWSQLRALVQSRQVMEVIAIIVELLLPMEGLAHHAATLRTSILQAVKTSGRIFPSFYEGVHPPPPLTGGEVDAEKYLGLWLDNASVTEICRVITLFDQQMLRCVRADELIGGAWQGRGTSASPGPSNVMRIITNFNKLSGALRKHLLFLSTAEKRQAGAMKMIHEAFSLLSEMHNFHSLFVWYSAFDSPCIAKGLKKVLAALPPEEKAQLDLVARSCSPGKDYMVMRHMQHTTAEGGLPFIPCVTQHITDISFLEEGPEGFSKNIPRTKIISGFCSYSRREYPFAGTLHSKALLFLHLCIESLPVPDSSFEDLLLRRAFEISGGSKLPPTP